MAAKFRLIQQKFTGASTKFWANNLRSHFFCTVRAVNVQARGGARDIIYLKTAPIIGLFFFSEVEVDECLE